MKKILFATTALVASAGFAAADVSFSGSAEAGIAAESGGDAAVYSFASLDVAFSGTSDNGIEFGASIDVTAGTEYDAGDFEFDGDADGTFGFGSAWISTGGLTLTFDNDGIDNLYDDDFSHDVQVSYAAGDITVDVTVDVDDSDATDYSFSIAYAAGAISASLAGDDGDDNLVLNLGYEINDMMNVGLEYDQNGGADVTTLTLGYASNGFSVDAEVDTDDGWSLGVGYTAGDLSVNASTDDAEEWEITGSYDFGGGLTAIAGINYDDSYYAGLTMSF